MAFADEIAALFERDLARLARELRGFPDEESLWRNAPGITNSAGNLALHLEGNLREYIGRQLGGISYSRDRPQEFAGAGISKDELAERAVEVSGLVSGCVSALSAEDLEKTYPENVLGAPMATRYFLVHLLGHLNYHLGQINYLRRFLA
jgi:hypothetical protein